MIRTNIAKAVLPSLIALLVAAPLANPAYAGTITGTVAGVTRDADGRPLPKAEVIAHSGVEGNADHVTLSDADGAYELSDLTPGEYEVRALKSGYRSAPATRILIAAASTSAFNPTLSFAGEGGAAAAAEPGQTASSSEVEELKQRVGELEAQVKALLARGTEAASATPVTGGAPVASAAAPGSPAGGQTPETAKATAPAAPAVDNITPFAYGDFTWLNGNPRNKDTVWDSKFFTPEVR